MSEQAKAQWTQWRAYCHYHHEDGSGAYEGVWRSVESEAERDRDDHDRDKHAGSRYARLEFK